MPTRVCVINRIVIAIAIEVQAVDILSIEICGVIGGNESAPFGAVIPGVAVVEAGIIVVVVTTVADGVGVGDGVVGGLGRNSAVALQLQVYYNLYQQSRKRLTTAASNKISSV